MPFWRKKSMEERMDIEEIKQAEMQSYHKEKLKLAKVAGVTRAKKESVPRIEGFKGAIQHIGKGLATAGRQREQFVASGFFPRTKPKPKITKKRRRAKTTRRKGRTLTIKY